VVEGEEMEEADENENEVNIDDIVDRAEAVEVSLSRALSLPARWSDMDRSNMD
jgi:hypothetical protein